MLDEFEIPYKTDVNVIKEKLQVKSNHINIENFNIESNKSKNKSLMKQILKNQLEHPISIHIARNKNSKNPATRLDIEALSKWVDCMVFNLYKNESDNIENLYYNLEVIYTAGLRELIRQISIENNERGQLFEKMWDQYMHIVSISLDEINNSRKKEAKQHIYETTKLHNLYKDQLENLNQEVNQLKAQIERDERENNNIRQYVQYIKKQNVNLNSELTRWKDEHYDLCKQVEKDQYEIITLKNEIQNPISTPKMKINFKPSSWQNSKQRKSTVQNQNQQQPKKSNRLSKAYDNQLSFKYEFLFRDLQKDLTYAQVQGLKQIIAYDKYEFQQINKQNEQQTYQNPFIKINQSTDQPVQNNQQDPNLNDILTPIQESNQFLYQSQNSQINEDDSYNSFTSEQLDYQLINADKFQNGDMKLEKDNKISVKIQASIQKVQKIKSKNNQNSDNQNGKKIKLNSNKKKTTKYNKNQIQDEKNDRAQQQVVLKQNQQDQISGEDTESEYEILDSENDNNNSSEEIINQSQIIKKEIQEKKEIQQKIDKLEKEIKNDEIVFDPIMLQLGNTGTQYDRNDVPNIEDFYQEQEIQTELQATEIKIQNIDYFTNEKQVQTKNVTVNSSSNLNSKKQITEPDQKRHSLGEQSQLSMKSYNEIDVNELEETVIGMDEEDINHLIDNEQQQEQLYYQTIDSIKITDYDKNKLNNCVNQLLQNKKSLGINLKDEIKNKINYQHQVNLLKLKTRDLELEYDEALENLEEMQDTVEEIIQDKTILEQQFLIIEKQKLKLQSKFDKLRNQNNEYVNEIQNYVSQVEKTTNQVSQTVDKMVSPNTSKRPSLTGNNINVENRNTLNPFNKSTLPGKRLSVLQIKERRSILHKNSPNLFKFQLEGQSLNVRRESRLSNASQADNTSQPETQKVKSNGWNSIYETMGKLKNNIIYSSSEDEDSDYYEDEFRGRNRSKNDPRASTVQNFGGRRDSSNNSQSYNQNITVARGPNFNKRRNAQKFNSVNSHAAIQLIQKIQFRVLNKKKFKLSQPLMMKQKLFKAIGQVYLERLKISQSQQSVGKNDPFHVTCYDYFIGQFGLKKVAERKVVQFYEAIIYHRFEAEKKKIIYNQRIHLISRFLELYLAYKDNAGIDFYLQTCQRLEDKFHCTSAIKDAQGPGFSILSSTADNIYVSIDKCIIEVDNLKLNNKISQENLNLMNDVINNKDHIIYDKQRKENVIDFDHFMEGYIECYLEVRQNRKILDQLFSGCDMDDNESMEFEEFMMLFKYIEKSDKLKDTKFMSQLRQDFLKHADGRNRDTDDMGLSKEKFIDFCLMFNYFSDEKIEKFKQDVDQNDKIKNIRDLKKNWAQTKKQLKVRFFIGLQQNMDKQHTYKNGMKKIQKQLTKDQNLESAWISYRILEIESKKYYLRQQVEDLIPLQLIQINNQYQRIRQDLDEDNILYTEDNDQNY